MKKNSIKFLEGAVVGLALGVAATLFMKSKTGKALGKNIKDATADFYKYAAPKIKKLGKITEKEYKEFMKKMAEEYSKARKISKEKTKELIQNAQKTWSHFIKN